MAMHYGETSTTIDPASGMTSTFSGFQSTLGGLKSTVGGMQSTLGGLMTPGWKSGIQSGVASKDLDLTKIGTARNKIMDMKLVQVSDSITGQTVVDPKGYLTDLNSMIPKYGGDINDIKKARKLLESVRQTNPKHPPAWIASASLEETVGKLQLARNLIMEGCEKNPKSEDLWLHAIRIHPPESAKTIVTNAVRAIPHSVRIWLKAADIEQDKKAKRRVFRKALEQIPTSVRLWKAAIELEEPEEARILLTRAVECCSTSTELWLALARLETYENARKVLNKAREHIPTDRQIWLSAARLEETRGQKETVDKIVERSLAVLRANMVEINRDHWLKDAIDAEQSGCPMTSKAIIKHVIGIAIEDQDKKATWLDDAKSFESQGATECARAVFEHMIDEMPQRQSVWREAAAFEKKYGTVDNYESLLKRGCETVPHAEELWLRHAKSRWLNEDVTGAREILSQAFVHNPNSEQIWMAAVKLESENNEFNRARRLLEKARTAAPSARLWMKSAHLEWCLGKLDAAKKLLQDGLMRYEDCSKLYMMLGQIYTQEDNYEEARKTFASGVRHCPAAIPLWILLSRLEESQNNATKARSDLDKARLRNPKNPELWLESIRLERRQGLDPQASEKMARALQECQKSGILWSEYVNMSGPHERRRISIDAIRNCEHDPHVLLVSARLLWAERKVKKAREWLERVVKVDTDFGDGWANLYKFEQLHGTEEQIAKVVQKCVEAEPRHGELWQSIAKNVDNWRKRTEEVLKMAAGNITIPT
ncbi:hypothetical protein WR25_27177 [Diploscapter pachys]|uniref:PRP6 homolog n=1 Tax=Diploscapter pachys TaxID=2018661 RepID=A0A2A2L0R3_9BILA|nr:hypothetical protein WR25_27177 [Diploscapter pachys]